MPALLARNPDCAVAADMDVEAARTVRREILDRIVESDSLVGGFHFPFPVFGRKVVAAKGYAFQPMA